MQLRICSYNLEWFDDLFAPDNSLRRGKVEPSDGGFCRPGVGRFDADQRAAAVGEVLRTVDADLYGLLEAPNTKADGSKSTITCLENFAADQGLRTRKAMTGYISRTCQELALLYDPDKLEARHIPSGGNRHEGPHFDSVWEFDTDRDGIAEVYKFARAPLEAELTLKPDGQQLRLILVHAKSKGIFSSVDMLRWQKEEERNRRRLLAECAWVRRRVDAWLDDGHQVVVMGDINDGPGMDWFELRFGRSAVDLLMGDLFEPDRILRNLAGRPRWTRYGWEPASARFRDRVTETYVNVLIDHVLVSAGLAQGADEHRVWNPYDDSSLASLKQALTDASDHYPVSLELNL
jgi:endonuclease/exonuclease/phosphatase family metal-dependent hydrolase